MYIILWILLLKWFNYGFVLEVATLKDKYVTIVTFCLMGWCATNVCTGICKFNNADLVMEPQNLFYTEWLWSVAPGMITYNIWLTTSLYSIKSHRLSYVYMQCRAHAHAHALNKCTHAHALHTCTCIRALQWLHVLGYLALWTVRTAIYIFWDREGSSMYLFVLCLYSKKVWKPSIACRWMNKVQGHCVSNGM